ncbi:MAG: T9SS type A sorting domain-containing protein [Sphingobacteriales bacterium]|nr:MAG: T9SS type A sorting domain-containing protein [Sphingobacteriales bacterium]
MTNSNTNSSNISFNFTGSGTIQTVDVQTQASNDMLRYKFFVKSPALVQIKNQDWKFADQSSLTVESGGTFDFGYNAAQTTALNITETVSSASTSFILQSGAVAKITSGDVTGAIRTSTLLGNVQLDNRSYDPNATYHYIGRTNQITGDGLPTAASGKKVIVELSTDALTLSNSSTTRFNSSGSLDIRKGTVLDNGSNFFDDGTNVGENGALIMTGGIYKFTGTVSVPGSTVHFPRLTGGYTITGGVIDLAGATAVSQYQRLRGGRTYYNIKMSGASSLGGYKDVTSAVVINNNLSVTETALLNSFDRTVSGNAGLTMDGGRWINAQNTGAQPLLDAIATPYLLTAGVLEFAGSAGQPIRGTANALAIEYNAIEVTGSDVRKSGSNITLRSGGSFKVKAGGMFTINDEAIIGPSGSQTVTVESNGIFRTADVDGFSGGTGTATTSVRADVENIVLDAGSTVEYARQASTLPSTASNGNQLINIPYSSGSPIAYQNLVLSGDGIKTPQLPGSTIEVKGNLTKNGSASFAHNEGTFAFTGNSLQTYTVNSPTYTVNSPGPIMEFNNVINGSSGLNIISDMAIAQSLKLNPSSQLNLSDTGDVILRSKVDKTAWVDIIPTNAIINYGNTAISGRFVVERFIKYFQRWNLLSAPVHDFQSVKSSWQEGGSSLISTGYGTRVTAPANSNNVGLDGNSTGHSLKSWNAMTATPGWDNVINTDTTPVNRPIGFFLFARGDRGFGPAQSPAGSVTTLRSRGRINVGNPGSGVEPTVVTRTSTSANGYFYSVANPFASAIDFEKVLERQALVNGFRGIKDQFYLWDPSDVGGYGVGKYVTIYRDNVSGQWIPQLPTPLYSATNYKTIQSGQAFFVEADRVGSSTVSFLESDKLLESRTVTRGTIDDLRMISTMLHHDPASIADGNRAVFGDGYSLAVAREDARKIINSGENFGLRRSGQQLAVEGHPALIESDTLFYHMTNLQTKTYKLSFEPRNIFATGLDAELVDKFLNRRVPVSLTDSTWYSFDATADAASKAADRFILVFRAPAGPLPVTFVSIAAQRQADRSIQVNWKVANEVNIAKYEVERSANGSGFTAIVTADATNGVHYSKPDLSPLGADNYYRIKAIGIAGDISYSPIVKVAPLKVAAIVSVYPNPVEGGVMSLQLLQQERGIHSIRLVDAKGSTVYKGAVAVNTDQLTQTINIGASVASGTYQLTIESPNGKLQTLQVFVK